MSMLADIGLTESPLTAILQRRSNCSLHQHVAFAETSDDPESLPLEHRHRPSVLLVSCPASDRKSLDQTSSLISDAGLCFQKNSTRHSAKAKFLLNQKAGYPPSRLLVSTDE